MAFNEFALTYEPGIRVAAFLGVFAVMAAWEAAAPRRRRQQPRAVRWTGNLLLVGLDTLLLRFAFPMAAVSFALVAEDRAWGLLAAADLPFWARVLFSVVALDFAIWLQHVMFHAVPVLWRLHRVHHADPDFDVTTGARFHPVEIALSMLIKLAVVGLLGAPALAVLLFEVLLNATAMFNHANVRLPEGLDRVLRRFVVTPDMHRVHHSMAVDEANSNFGFNLPWWDRLFGTYRAATRLPQEQMEIGVRGLSEDPRAVRLAGLLVLPFIEAGEDMSIGHGLEPTRDLG